MTTFFELDTAPAAGTSAPTTARRKAGSRRSVARISATTGLLAGAGVVAVALAPSASALAAPTHAGWDGQRYWFQHNGEWRWTSHLNVYLQYTGSTVATEPAAPDVLGLPTKQGWDGHRYWFQYEGGWHWTTHYTVYLQYTSPTGTAAGAPKPAPVATSTAVDTAIAFAEAQLGKPYIWGGNGPVGYDCSGLVQQAFLRAGISLPRVAVDQYAASRPISASSLRRGDLLFWSSTSRSSGIHHVAIYLGGGQFIEAPRPGLDVRVATLSAALYPTQFGRVVQ